MATLPAAAQSSGGISSGKGSPPVIKNKPEPNWPHIDKKKSDLVIVLRAIFTSEAKVTNIKLFETRPQDPADYSENEVTDLVNRATEAARGIRFIPAMKDGKKVSMLMQLEYTFHFDNDDPPPAQERKKP